MSIDFGKASDKFDAVMSTNGGRNDIVQGGGVFTVTCHDADGNLKWEDDFHNLVPSQGLQYMSASFFNAVGYTTALYFGLITGPSSGTTFSAGDTLLSHGATGSGGWTESTAVGSRKAITFGTPTTATPSETIGTSAVFTVTSATTIAGAFVTTASSGTSGFLFAEGDFSADKVVTIGDTLAVTYTFSLTSS
jgi:hypothetical protein